VQWQVGKSEKELPPNLEPTTPALHPLLPSTQSFFHPITSSHLPTTHAVFIENILRIASNINILISHPNRKRSIWLQ
jgi:hypothetical protein